MQLRLKVLHYTLFFWIFFIPSALSWHYNESAGIVNGVIVDYRIPTVFVSTLFLILFLFAFSLVVQPKTLQCVADLGQTVKLALLFTIVFQLFVAIFQFQSQHSLFGYLPFGEVNLSTPTIAKAAFLNGVLYKLPYGTTAHPNVLAGVMVLFVLLLSSFKKLFVVNWKLEIVLLLIAFLLCFLTQSISACLALIVGLLVLKLKNLSLPLYFIRVITACIPILTIMVFATPIDLTKDSPSFFRRTQLQSIAIKMIKASPKFGVGWNNFTLQMEDYGYVSSTTRFLQPVHHVFLLLISEMGLLGWILFLCWEVVIIRMPKFLLSLGSALTIIGSMDHYLVSLNTGRMVLLLILGVILIYQRVDKNKNGSV